MIRASTVTRLGCKVSVSPQSTHLADGSSSESKWGIQNRLSLSHGFSEGLVVENLDTKLIIL